MVGGRLASLVSLSMLPLLLAASCASKDAGDATSTTDSQLDQHGDATSPPDAPPQDIRGELQPLDTTGSDVTDSLQELGDLAADLDADGDLDLPTHLDAGEDFDVMPDLADDHEPPLISNLAVAPGEANVVSAQITFTTNEKAVWKLRRTDMVTGIQQTVTPTLPAAKNHKVPVVGLHASRSYEFVLTVTDLAGNEVTTEVLPFQTQALPDDFPPCVFWEARRRGCSPASHSSMCWTGPISRGGACWWLWTIAGKSSGTIPLPPPWWSRCAPPKAQFSPSSASMTALWKST